MIFAHFQTKRDITRGAKTLQWGGQHRGWGGFGPSSIYVKKGSDCLNNSPGKCKVDNTEKGWFITYIDRDPETLAKQKVLQNSFCQCLFFETHENAQLLSCMGLVCNKS